MIHAIRRWKTRRAVAAVELAVCLPLILTLLLGIWEVGRLIEIQQLVTNAAREAGRQAATGQLTNSQVQAVVTQYLAQTGLPTGNVVTTITITDPTGVAVADASQATYLDTILITVSIPYSDVRWTLISLVTQPGEQISATVQWISMVDKPYPSSPEPPVG
jgi:Flp pilus assembly protein TadG